MKRNNLLSSSGITINAVELHLVHPTWLFVHPYTHASIVDYVIATPLLGRHGSVSLCRDERENKMAATYNVLAFKR